MAWKSLKTGSCLLMNESSAESSCRSFLHYFRAAINNHLYEKPKICCLIWSLNTGLTVSMQQTIDAQANLHLGCLHMAYSRMIIMNSSVKKQFGFGAQRRLGSASPMYVGMKKAKTFSYPLSAQLTLRTD